MEKRIEVTNGYKLVDENNNIVGYETATTMNGECYKDEEAFKKKKGVCYISEYEYSELLEELSNLKSIYENGEESDEEYRTDIQFILQTAGWTYDNILELVGGKGFERVAEFIFSVVDWQSPETYFQEFLDDIGTSFFPLEQFGLTKKMVEDEWGIVLD